MTRINDATLQTWIANADQDIWDAHPTFDNVVVNRREEIAIRRELLTLRALVRDVAAKNPGWYDDILHTYVCLFCELTNPDIEQLEPVSQHDPECAYRRAVAWAREEVPD